MIHSQTANAPSRDLFGGVAVRHGPPPAGPRRLPPELAAARALCRQIRRKQTPPDKQRIAHLICLNLVSMLKRGPKP